MTKDLGLLLLRLGFGLTMLFGHGWRKLTQFGEIAPQFPDPIGLGSQVALGLAVGAEFFCALAIVIGLYTRWLAIPLAFTMLVAFAVIHSADPWSTKEMAFLFLIAFSAIVLLGPGKYSLDARLRKNSV